MEVASRLLYLVSTALQAPVIVILLLLLAWTTLQTGRVLREFIDLRRYRNIVREAIRSLKNGDRFDLDELSELRGPGRALFLATHKEAVDETILAKIVDDVQIALDDRANRIALGVRLGPMFGLMGTLIPMGPALTGLASGDINVLTENLVVAFSTTVLGLLIGGVCYVLLAITRRAYAQDLSDLDFMHDMLLKTKGEYDADADEPAHASKTSAS